MGRWKDAFYLEVWKHLLTRNNHPEPLSQLNAPTAGYYGIKNAWGDLQANAREERMKKATGLKVVLSDRPDLFQLTPNAAGHLCIQLTRAAQSFDPQEGVPAVSVVASINQAAKDIEAALAGDAALAAMGGATGSMSGIAAMGGGSSIDSAIAAMGGGSALAAMGGATMGGTTIGGGDMGGFPPMMALPSDGSASPPASVVDPLLQMAELIDGPRPDKHEWAELYADPASAAAAKKKKAKTTTQPPPGMNKRGLYMDLVWTPTLAAVKEREERLEKEMARALLHAAEQYRGQDTAVSKLGFDFKVARIKKDNHFKNEKLLDILKRHPDVFELVPDGQGGFNVLIQPGALGVLYTDEELEAKNKAEAMLPPKLENPYNIRERMQALRIEVIHALHHRGGASLVQELGQEPGVQQAKQTIAQAKKLQDFVKLFPHNFILHAVDSGSIIQLLSYDVADRSMIDQSVQQNIGFGKGSKCGGKGGKGMPPRSFGGGGYSSQFSFRGTPMRDSLSSFGSRGGSGGFSSAPAPPPGSSARGAGSAAARVAVGHHVGAGVDLMARVCRDIDRASACVLTERAW